jgi:hypothetical protein
VGIKQTLLSFLHAFSFAFSLTDDSLPDVSFSPLCLTLFRMGWTKYGSHPKIVNSQRIN